MNVNRNFSLKIYSNPCLTVIICVNGVITSFRRRIEWLSPFYRRTAAGGALCPPPPRRLPPPLPPGSGCVWSRSGRRRSRGRAAAPPARRPPAGRPAGTPAPSAPPTTKSSGPELDGRQRRKLQKTFKSHDGQTEHHSLGILLTHECWRRKKRRRYPEDGR